ncbi:MAG: hypothetical protein AMXMBFR64_02760 [Myxococcales bacterium]
MEREAIDSPDALACLALLVAARGAPAQARRQARARGLPLASALPDAVQRRAAAEVGRLDALGARCLAPQALPPLPDPPLLLMARGDVSLLGPSTRRVAIVGSRDPDLYGVEAARRFANALALEGLVIVSGGARGVDAEVHRSTLAAGGRTVVVLASGFDHPSPASSRPLLDDVLRHGGLLLTEVPPGYEARPHYFPDRNRLIAALSEVVLIAQAAARSGTLQTAGQARALGRPVLAVPGDVCYRSSAGTNGLLARGEALAATHPADVLRAMGIDASAPRWPLPGRRAPDLPPGWLRAPQVSGGAGTSSVSAPTSAIAADPRAARVLSHLAGGPMGVDALAERSGEPAWLVLAALGAMELAGAVRRTPGGEWSLRAQADGRRSI